MKYTTPHHTALQTLTAIAKRAHKWVRIQAVSCIATSRPAIYRHAGTAY